MKITRTTTSFPLRSTQNTTPQPTQEENSPPMNTADKVALGGTLVSMGGLATSIGTFMSAEAGMIPMWGSSAKWGGLGGMALFVGGAAVAGIAILASKES